VRIILELRQNNKFPLKDLLRIAKIAKSTYHDTVKRLSSPDRDEWLESKIQAIYDDHKGKLGYPRITIELNKDLEIQDKYGKVNHKRIYRIMKKMGLKSIQRVKKYNMHKGTVGKIANNELNRDFSTTRSLEKVVTDVTEFKICGKRIYLSPLLDLHTKEVLSYSISQTPTVEFVMEMMRNGLKEENYKSLTIHTDQGFQCQNARFRSFLDEKEITQSMSRKGNCYDNACAENFFSILKAEFFHIKNFKSIDLFIEELKEYLNYYNSKRIVTKLKMTPNEYRDHCLA